jgi:hypothetical protein
MQPVEKARDRAARTDVIGLDCVALLLTLAFRERARTCSDWALDKIEWIAPAGDSLEDDGGPPR